MGVFVFKFWGLRGLRGLRGSLFSRYPFEDKNLEEDMILVSLMFVVHVLICNSAKFCFNL